MLTVACLLFVFLLATPAFIATPQASSEESLTPGKARLVHQVTVRDLPSAASDTASLAHKVPFLVPDPAAFSQAKVASEAPGFVPAGQDQKVLAATTTGPLTVSSDPSLGGAPGGSPNPCSCSPPDVNVGVGPSHVFETVNLAGIIYFTTGAVAKSTFALSDFFGIPTSSMSDPQVFYDPMSKVWFASVIDIPNNRVQFAVSTGSDPTGTWNVYSFVSAGSYLPDQPFIGASDDKFVITANDFLCVGTCRYKGAQFWVLNKAQLVSGALTVDYVTSAPSTSYFSVQPARHLNSPLGLFYMVSVGVGSTSTGNLRILTGTPPGPVTVTTYSFSINPLSSPPDAEQPGSNTLLATNDDRVLSAVWNSNTLWFSAGDSCVPAGDSATRSCPRLIQLTTSGTSAPTKVSDFDYASNGNYLFYPAVSLDSANDLVAVYGLSSSSTYPSLYATGRLPSDSVNTVETPALLASGSDIDTSTRYGDYFGAATDPSSASTFWVAGEFRISSTFQGWSTAIAKVSLSAPLGLFDFSLSNSGGITVDQGASGSNTITATLTSGVSQSVSFACTSGLPSGAACSFSPSSGLPTFSSTLTVSTSGSTPAGSYTVTVTGTGGSLSRTTSFTLTVNTPPPAGLSVSVTTNKGSYAKGSVVTITVQVTSSGVGVSGATVSLTINNPSSSTVATFSGTTAPSGSVQFTWTIPSTALSGVYSIQATATKTGYTSGSGTNTFRVK